MELIIPKRFSNILNDDTNWRSFVDNLIICTKNYFIGSPYFFPEYTFHGTSHINKVLEYSDKLIHDGEIEKLTSLDIAVLVSSIILHDIGMFIEKAGVQKLIFGEYQDRTIDLLDSISWGDAWSEYIKRIRRYSEKELLMNFGTTDPVGNINPLDSDAINEKDRKIYGGFVRENHHRIAHDFAMLGFLGQKDSSLFDSRCNPDIANIIGLVARSHCINMRETEEYLKCNFGADDNFKTPLGIPIFYLMSLVRIADILDVGIERAPTEVYDTKYFYSYISQLEWRWNQTISQTSGGYRWDFAKKKLNIHATPKNSDDFLGVEKWMKNIQAELDTSWSVILEHYAGEYYLSIHRVTSNIFDQNARKNFDTLFLTKMAELKVNPELLKLMVEPLYRSNPSYGVRELIQNAVDACNERKTIDSDYIFDTSEVLIEINNRDGIFRISDNGTGMNENILLNYYLSAGSSYRYSENWIKDNIDKDGHSATIRTGKFGVGALAAFLLGESITITTQHISDNLGYKLTFGIEPINIKVERIERSAGTGTTIEIKLNNRAKRLFEEQTSQQKRKFDDEVNWYDWYHFERPALSMTINGEACSFPMITVPRLPRDNPNWKTFRSSHFQSYMYTFDQNSYRSGLYCNGIIIPEIPLPYYQYYGLRLFAAPTVSVVDTDANLQVDLLRNRLIGFPDEKRLVEDIYKRLIITLLSTEKNPVNGFNFLDDAERCLIFNTEGFTLCESAFISQLDCDYLHFIFSENQNIFPQDYENVIRKFTSPHPICWISNQAFGQINTTGYNYGLTYVKTDQFFSEYYLNFKNFPKKKTRGFTLLKQSKIARISYSNARPSNHNTIAKLIKKYLNNDVWIPYDMDERKRKYKDAFSELSDLI